MAASTTDAVESLIIPDGDFSQNDKIHASQKHLPLYNADSTLDISQDVADGFLIILSAGQMSARSIRRGLKSKKIRKKHEIPAADRNCSERNMLSPTDDVDLSAIQLCFAALTEGNVIEATFGVETTGGLKRSKNTSKWAYAAAKNAKAAIANAAMTSESIKRIAVNAYCKCFEIVIIYNFDLERTGIITWCSKQRKIRKKAEKRLRDAISQLEEAIAAST